MSCCYTNQSNSSDSCGGGVINPSPLSGHPDTDLEVEEKS